MSLWDNTPNTLTSFTPLSSDVQSSGNFISRFFKRGKDDSDPSSNEGSKTSSRNVSREQSLDRTRGVSGEVSREASVDSVRDHREKSLDTISQKGNTSSSPDLDNTSTTSSSPTKSNNTDASKRTLSSVITRLSAIVDRRTSGTPQVYRDSDFKQYWMPDSSCRECYDCGDKFTTFRRRHHCRVCGQIFCNGCCSQELSGKIIGYKGSIRVCTYCYQIVQRYAQKSDNTGNPTVTKEVLDKYLESDKALSPEQGVKGHKKSLLDLQGQFSLRSPGDIDGSQDGTAPFDLTPQSEFVCDTFSSERRLLIQDSLQLRGLWTLMMDSERGLEFQSFRVRLRTYQKCVAGNRLVDWLLKQDKVANRVQAVAIGQALIDAENLVPIQNTAAPFRDDFSLYRPLEVSIADAITPDYDDDSLSEDSAPQWFQDIQTNTLQSDNLPDDVHIPGPGPVSQDLTQSGDSGSNSELSQDSSGKIKVDERHFDEPLPQENLLDSDIVAGSIFGTVGTLPVVEPDKSATAMKDTASWRTLDIASEDTAEKEAFERLQQEHHEYLTHLTKQLLGEDNLPAGWADIIISTVDRVSLFVKPDIKHNSDDMDIRRYVHIKKIPGGKREQTALVHGVIFTKNVAHKKMSQHVNNPAVLLLSGCVEYQRVENKLSSLQPQILQEKEYLYKIVEKIGALTPKPDVLVVEKSVSRLAQEFLLHKGITLVYNVKLSVLERLSRFLDTDIATSVDSLVRGLPSVNNLQGSATSNSLVYAVKLGLCHKFSVRNFVMPSGDTKTLMYFDGCATHLGCAVTLQGGTTMELKRVKKIMKFMIYASYHSRLEISFCMDEFLMPPSKQEIEFDLDQIGEMGSKGAKSQANEEKGVKTSEKDGKGEITDSEVGDLNKICVTENAKLEKMTATDQNIDVPVFFIDDSDKEGKDLGIIDGESTVVRTADKNVESHGNEEKYFDNTSTDCVQVVPSNEVLCETGSSQETLGNKIEIIESNVECNRDLRVKSERQSSFINIEDTVVDTNNTQDNSEDALHTDSQSNPRIPFVCDIDQSGAGLNERSQSTPTLTSHKTKNMTSSIINKSLTVDAKTISSKMSSDNILVEQVDLRKRNKSGQKNSKSPNVVRKTNSVQLTDHSDPLNNYQRCQDDSIFQSTLALQEHQTPHRLKFRKALDNVALSTSPYIKYDLPYLETEAGSKCELRKYFSEDIYWSNHLSVKPGRSRAKSKYTETEPVKKYDQPTNIEITEAHEFIRAQLNLPYYDRSTQYMLAKFRAYGGRINVLQSVKVIKDEQKISKLRENQSMKGRQLVSEEGTQKGDNCPVVWEKRTDCLDPERHQRIAVLFSSFSYESENHPSPCVYPWVVTMEFYRRNDITLGGFLERFCFRPSYVCPSDSCSTSMLKHIRRFVHGQGSISVILKKLEQPILNGQHNILIWSWCHKCKQVTPVVPMSTDTWNMSFAKYLELRFHGTNFLRRASVDVCLHSLHHEHFQYFGYNDTVASFKYAPIKLKEIKLPPFVIACHPQMETIQLFRLKDEVKRLTVKMTDMYSQVLDYMTKLRAECMSEPLVRTVSECLTQQQSEKSKMRELALQVREKVTLLLQQGEERKVMTLDNDQKIMYAEVEDGIVLLKKNMAEVVTGWNGKLQELYMQQKKAKQGTNQKKDKDRDTVSINSASVVMETDDRELKSGTVSAPVLVARTAESDPGVNTAQHMPIPGVNIAQHVPIDDTFSMSGSSYISEARRKSDFSVINFSPPPIIEPANFEVAPDDLGNFVDSMETGSLPTTIATSLPDKELETISESRESQESTALTEKLSMPGNIVLRKSPAEEQLDGQYGDKMGAIKKTIMSTIWQGSGAFQLQSPFEACEHYLLPLFDQIPVVVYDHEPSSIIAYTLGCSDYHTKLHEIQASISQCQRSTTSCDNGEKTKDDSNLRSRPSSGKLSFFKGNTKDKQEMPDTVKYDTSQPDSPLDEMEYSLFTSSTTESLDKSKSNNKQVTNLHIELQFADTTARFYCKVYFAEQFRQLRKYIFPEGEEIFIRSLSRCKPWEAKGGKSGSSFCKTDDDRFILKQMSSMEVESFEKFGPQYFQYISSPDRQQRPTALTKIVGVYRIGFRNQHTNNAMKQDLLVMENLFYNRNISQTFDLKGSERNRLVKATRKRGDEELVLLDENFLRVSVDCPLYILPHSKTMLTCAIGDDSQFLSSNFVMDYSLLVGLDEQNKELVVGIIDYIRTFTWDKKLETILKSQFGGQGKMPTVVSPEVYRSRFFDAMAKYFLSVPDQWCSLGKDTDT